MSSIDAAKAAMGYVAGRRVPSCRTCKHCFEQITPGAATKNLRCSLGAFNTSANAICNKQEPRK